MKNYHLKYRPKTLEEVRGNSDLITTLQAMLTDKEKFPHSILLHGNTGCGKTSLARIIANELGCVGSDYREVNSSNFNGVDDIREIIQNSMFKPLESPVRVWVLDEVQKASSSAFNALLKILEEPPAHIYFILATTELQKIPAAIKNRCSPFQVKTLKDKEMFGLLRMAVRKENETLDTNIYDQIIQDSLGQPRNALQILEQVLSVPTDKRLEIAKQAAEQQSEIIELCRALVQNSSWSTVKTILTGLKGTDAESIRRVVLGYCQAILLKGENDRAAAIIEAFWEPLYNIGWPGLTYICYTITVK